MRNILIIISFVLATNLSNSQASLELETGGSNFLGSTLNIAYEIQLLEKYKLSLKPYLGIGSILPVGYGPASILHGGLEYRFGRSGIGIEASAFRENLFFPGVGHDFVDVLLYPHYSYYRKLRGRTYIKVSLGLYFAYFETLNPQPNELPLEWESPVIPGIGITFGYHLNNFFGVSMEH